MPSGMSVIEFFLPSPPHRVMAVGHVPHHSLHLCQPALIGGLLPF
jgi:hypothetical protein